MARSKSSSGSSQRWMNCFIFAAYLRFMLSVFAGFSAFRKRAKSLSIVSFRERVGYLRRFSLTSLRPRVTMCPRACSMKEIESSIFCKLYRETLSSGGGIFTGRAAFEYLKGFARNL